MLVSDIPNYIKRLAPRLVKVETPSGYTGPCYKLYGTKKVGAGSKLKTESDAFNNWCRKKGSAGIIERHLYFEDNLTKEQAWKAKYINYLIFEITPEVEERFIEDRFYKNWIFDQPKPRG